MLALGIGSTTALATVARGVILDSLPFAVADRLVYMMETVIEYPHWLSWDNYLDWERRNRTFESLAAHTNYTVGLTGGDRAESVFAVYTTSNLFPMLGVKPLLGTLFGNEADQPGAKAVAVLDHGFWQRRYGGSHGVLGQILEVEGRSFEIIGVLPSGFLYPRFTLENAFYLPLAYFAENWERQSETHPGITATGLLRPGVSLAAARDDMERVAAELAAEYPDVNRDHGVYLKWMRDEMVGDFGAPLLALGAAVALVLTLAAVSVASLLLAASAGRSQELGVRYAVGASRVRLAAGTVAESIVLSLLGAVAGLGLAYTALAGLKALINVAWLPAFGEIALDGEMAAFAAVTALVTGLLAGLAPAIETARETVGARSGATRASSGRRRQRLIAALVSLQLGLSLALALGSGLALTSFIRIMNADPGFDSRNVLTFSTVLVENKYPSPEQQNSFYEGLVERLRTLPGVVSAVNIGGPFPYGLSTTFVVEGGDPEKDRSGEIFKVGSGFFEVLGIELLGGRFFDNRDRADAPPTVIVGQRLATTVWPEGAVGQRIRLATDPVDGPWREVVGVVRHLKNQVVQKESELQFYVPSAQEPLPYGWGLVRSAGDPLDLGTTVDRLISELDPSVSVDDLTTLEDRLLFQVAGPRFLAACLSFFALATLLVAVVGVYGITAGSVTQRRREIGVRMALGGRPTDIVRLILAQGLRLALAGVVLGLSLAWAGTSLLAHQLYGIGVGDPMTWLTLPPALALVALAACALPAWRATRLDPATALREA